MLLTNRTMTIGNVLRERIFQRIGGINYISLKDNTLFDFLNIEEKNPVEACFVDTKSILWFRLCCADIEEWKKDSELADIKDWKSEFALLERSAYLQSTRNTYLQKRRKSRIFWLIVVPMIVTALAITSLLIL